MPVCQECRKFFALENEGKRGDCVQRVIDPRQAYYKAKPVSADHDASTCREFEKRQSVPK